MFYNLRKKLKQSWFDFHCANIYRTPPVVCDPGSDVVVISQLYHPDMAMYLLAAKSFSHYLAPREFVIVDDGLLAEDKRVLSRHFSSIRFVPREAVSTGRCPVGACWERLFTLCEVNRDSYVIQLDSDTLTLSDPMEVRQSVAGRRSFTLGTSTGRDFVGLEEASRYAFTRESDHVQIRSERAFKEYPGKERLKYVRGCAGFAGFARGHLSVEAIEEFSTTMEGLLGHGLWRQWGSEQVVSNFMVANGANSLVLPVERYPFWIPGLDMEGVALAHFFGTFRFSKGMYLRQARRVIERLK